MLVSFNGNGGKGEIKCGCVGGIKRCSAVPQREGVVQATSLAVSHQITALLTEGQ